MYTKEKSRLSRIRKLYPYTEPKRQHTLLQDDAWQAGKCEKKRKKDTGGDVASAQTRRDVSL